MDTFLVYLCVIVFKLCSGKGDITGIVKTYNTYYGQLEIYKISCTQRRILKIATATQHTLGGDKDLSMNACTHIFVD